MGWSRTEDDDGGRRWERSDGYAIITARATATGEWAVSLDRLEQAPEGPAYEHETVASREEALALAERWRDAHETP